MEVELKTTDGIVGVRIAVRGVVSGISVEQFEAVAERAKDDCPVSKALSGNRHHAYNRARLTAGGVLRTVKFRLLIAPSRQGARPPQNW